MKNLVVLFCAIVTLSSCNFYKPAVINAPIFKERGEIELGVSVGNGTDITAGYSITDHIAVSGRFTSNINLDSETSVGDSVISEFSAPNYNYEFAVGYFNDNDKFNYSVYAGYLLGKTAALNDEFFTDENNFLFGEELSIAADMSSFFVQASGFYNIDDQSHIGLVTRFNVLEFDNFRTSQFFTNNATDIKPSNTSQTVGQVGFQYNLKLDHFGFMAQLQYAFSGSSDPYFTLRQTGVHIGAYIRIGELLKK